jgi:translation initiation factor 1 (eIF-1/SUI1)
MKAKTEISDSEVYSLIEELRKECGCEIRDYAKWWYQTNDRPVLSITLQGGLNEKIINTYRKHGLDLTGSSYAYGGGYNTYKFARPRYTLKEIEE